MRKKVLLIAAIVIICLSAVCFGACGKRFTVTYNANGGDAIAPTTLKEGEIIQPPTPSQTGMQFLGWYTDADFSTPLPAETVITADITLYAKWQPTNVTVSYVTNIEATIESETVPYGQQWTQPETPLRANYSLFGWYTEEKFVNLFDFSTIPTRNVTLYALWVPTLRTTENSDGTINIAGKNAHDTEIIIPEQVDGKTVTTISRNAFNESDIVSITLPATLVSIADYAFNRCAQLTSVTFAEGAQLTTIGAAAFRQCDLLQSIDLPDSVRTIGANAFEECYALTSIEIPSGTETLGQGIFKNCSALTSVTIPESVTSVGNKLFDGCNKLVQVTNLSDLQLSDLPVNVGLEVRFSLTDTFKNSLSVDDDGFITFGVGAKKYLLGYNGTSSAPVLTGKGFTDIYPYAFSKNIFIVSITLPKGIKTIGDYAFEGCTALESVSMSEDVLSLGNYAFARCTALTTVTLSVNLKTIGNYAFSYCTALPAFEITTKVSSIGTRAFERCNALTLVVIPYSVSTIGDHAFHSWTNTQFISIEAIEPQRNWSTDWLVTSNCKANVEWGLNKVTDSNIYNYVVVDNKAYLTEYKSSATIQALNIPATIGDIPVGGFGSIFAGITTITSVYIPASVTSIADSAFRDCERIASISIAENSQIESIGDFAFDNCKVLASINLGSNSKITTIGTKAFQNCPRLTSITLPTTLETLGAGAFWGCARLVSTNLENTQITSIYEDTFNGCKALNSAGIPSTVESIGIRAFDECIALRSITIPASVKVISARAFVDCTALTSVTFENTAGWYVCNSLNEVSGTAVNTTVVETNATNLIETYVGNYWKCNN